MNDKKKPRTGSRRPTGSRPAPAKAAPPQRKKKPVTTASAPPAKKKKKKHSKVFRIFKKLMAVIATTLLSLLLIMIITGTIVTTALTVYVLDFMEETTGITLQELESGSNTYFYNTTVNEDGETEFVKLFEVKTDVQRMPISIDEIPQHVRDPFVYTEDERFYTHDGVDYKRTFSAFLNMFIHIYNTDQGGSTITQQLVKNLTGDDEKSPSRKIREIFRAMQLEKTYSKDEILEEYLNYIGFGGPINGIELASVRYFGKHTSELSVAEAATLAAIPKSPNTYYPIVKTDKETGKVTFDGRTNNKERQQYVLWQMYKNGAITYDEYQQYLNEKLIFTDMPEYIATHPEDAVQELEAEQKNLSWVLDAMYYEAADFLADKFNIDRWEAIKRINKGGYKIYTNVDMDMQNYVEEKMLSLENLKLPGSLIRNVDLDDDGEPEEYIPHIAFTALNYDGSVRCTVGNIGERTAPLCTNYAVDEPRQIGSTMKPISTYGYALENDIIHWGTSIMDSGVMEVNGRPWPSNYSSGSGLSISNSMVKVYMALQKSYNTIPAHICVDAGPRAIWEFCTDKMGLMLDPADESPSPLSIGALTYGIPLQNLVNAFLPYGNQGVQCDAHIVTKIEQGTHDIIYENNGNPREAVSAETAWVMNRLLKNVVEHGTGTAAKLSNKVVCGKTGTTENWYNLTFVGLTRDFVSGITIGYKKNDKALQIPTSIKSGQIWQNIIGEYANSIPTPSDFDSVDTVKEAPMCEVTGEIAGAGCPKGVIGYWKSSNAPVCSGAHGGIAPEPATDENGQPITQPSQQTATSAGGGNEQPPQGGNEQPPQGGNEQPPQGGNEQPPQGGNDTPPPEGGGNDTPPPEGGGVPVE